ncbi:MAG: hypothetical protein K8R90_11265 [Candidatus Cloacimonetes bacterium]|nr:hypothetical protein [Candidatus Cloacimonadota bacterium]
MKLSVTLLLISLALSLVAGESLLSEAGWSLLVQAEDPQRTTLTFTLDDWRTSTVDIGGQIWHQVHMGDAERTFEKGAPALPKLSRSLLIPASERMAVRVLASAYIDHPLLVAPSKGLLSRTIDPATVPYSFGPVYSAAAPWPAELATLGEPYILHQARGQTITLHPFQYLPAQGVLRVYSHLVVEVVADGEDDRNILVSPTETANLTWDSVYARRFINYPLTRYSLVPEYGRMVVICHDDWTDEIAPWVDWKRRRGIETDVWPVSQVGSAITDIQTFIQAQYDQGDGLTFVQLVGDAQQIPPYSFSNHASDPSYALVAGADSYPDIFIGRFSAQFDYQVVTQVERSIHYERDLAAATWLADGTGIASSQGAGIGDDGEADWVHLDNIRTDLLGYTYAIVDQIYATNGGAAADVTDAVNAGRSIINYCGHGTTGSWCTTGFNVSDINNLTNTSLLPFIYSVACVNGNFTNTTCFAEAWLRATHSATGEPTGGIGVYASSNNQTWAPPMCAQDEFADLLCAETLDTFGALCFNSSCQMMDEYGVGGENMFRTWHVFGDASLLVRTADPQPLTVSIPDSLEPGDTGIMVDAGIEHALAAVSLNGSFVASAYTGASGEAPLNLPTPAAIGDTYDITVTARNRQTWQGDVSVTGESPPVTGIRAISFQGDIHLSWDAYPDATGYNIYTAETLRGGYSFLEQTVLTQWSAPMSEPQRFYYITAQLP